MYIRIADCILESIVDGPGIRAVVFFQGCKHNCLGCHNADTHPVNGGELMTVETLIDKIGFNPLRKGLTISGGEPFLQSEALAILLDEYRKLFPKEDIIVYTGFTYEYLVATNNKDIKNILKKADFLIDGKYEQEKRDWTLRFRGSANQRVIDLQKSTIENIIYPEWAISIY